MLVVDTGPLVAAADTSDPDHRACADLLEQAVGPLRTTALVVAEAAYLIGRRIGAEAEAAFFRSIANGDLVIDALLDDDLSRMASLVALAERLKQETVATLDRRHFTVVRPAHVPGFQIVPPLD